MKALHETKFVKVYAFDRYDGPLTQNTRCYHCRCSYPRKTGWSAVIAHTDEWPYGSPGAYPLCDACAYRHYHLVLSDIYAMITRTPRR